MLNLHLRKLTLHGLSALTLVSVFGCSLTIDPDLKQCKQDSDCAGRGGDFTGTQCINSACQAVSNWECLDTARQVVTPSGIFQVTVEILDGTTLLPLTGAQVRACKKIDVTCSGPESSGETDENGRLTLSINAETGVFLNIVHAGMLPTLYFFNPPPTADTTLEPIHTIKTELLPVMTSLVGAEQLSERGLVYVTAVNCAGKQTAGVSLAVAEGDAQTVPYYIIDSYPSRNATATDKDGWGGFFNLKKGGASVTGQLQDGQRTLGTINLLVEPGTVTYGRLVPLGK
jgi:hypothetical protein